MTDTALNSACFAIGERVAHAKWGAGTVAELDGNKVSVEFDDGGLKKILNSFLTREDGEAPHFTVGDPDMTATAPFPDIDPEARHPDYARLEAIQDDHGGELVDFPDRRRYLKDVTIEGRTGCVRIEMGRPGKMVFWDAAGTLDVIEHRDPENLPVDIWAQRKHPPLPRGLLPKVIGDFASIHSVTMGADAGGLAMAALAACAAAIPDGIKLQVKRHDPSWLESARIWVALVGDPSTKKSPIISAASWPIKKIDREMFRIYAEQKQVWDRLSKEDKGTTPEPANVRLRIEDTTIEAAQEVIKDSPNGVLCLQDELSGWFGSMDKYSSGRGSAKDRGFWLQSFNGGSYVVNRIGRGSSFIDNLSVSMLGGIQPEPMRKLASEAQDDGLLQRLFPVVLSPATVGVDEAAPPVVATYEALVERLHKMQRARQGLGEVDLRFSDAAQELRASMEAHHNELVLSWAGVSGKLSAHIGKYDGLFARLCVLWHCIESTGTQPAPVVEIGVAERVAEFLHEYLLPHSIAFYSNVLGLSEHHDAAVRAADYILAHDLKVITTRDIQRGDRGMRKLDKFEAEKVLHQLDAMGWLDPLPLTRNETLPRWRVRTSVHHMFAEQARKATERRARIREIITQAPANPETD